MLCDYGCRQEAKYQFKNGKWCCSENFMQCPAQRKKNSIQKKKAHRDPNSKYNLISCKEKMSNSMKEIWKNPNSIFNSKSYRKSLSNGVKKSWTKPNSMLHSISCKEKKSNSIKEIWKNPNSKYNSISYISKLNKSHKLTIKKIKEKYPTFVKEEEMRYNPDKKEIQVHCKNHECENSKEKDGWFTPAGGQLAERIRQLENNDGNDGSYFYCSQECKDNCILHNLRSDPYKDPNSLPYTQLEIQIYNKIVLDRENGLCEYCGEPATIVHHIRPKKLEPFFALDPDFGVAVCEKCHYEKGHKDECSTGNLAKIVCSVESQKFLNQILENI